MRRLRALLLSIVWPIMLSAACNVPSARHPLLGHLRPVKSEPGYWIFLDDDWLHVRVTSGDKPRRFQGSVTAVRSPRGTAEARLGGLELDRPALAQQVAAAYDSRQGDSIQFDLEPARHTDEGFRVRLASGCVRFDLYVDGAHRPDRVRLGSRRFSPRQIPFERCP
jgi:hypothetical protein